MNKVINSARPLKQFFKFLTSYILNICLKYWLIFSASPSGLNGYMAINGTRENDTDYLRMAKKGGGHAGLCLIFLK